MDEFRTFGP